MSTLFSVIKNNLAVTQYFLLSESRNEAGNRVLVLTRSIGGRPVTVHLEFTKDQVWVTPAKYTFTSRTSHFDYAETEQRWSRRKDIMLGLVRILQKAGVWPFITNKKFFKVNENCKDIRRKKTLKKRVEDEMFETLQPRMPKQRQEIKELENKATALLKGTKG